MAQLESLGRVSGTRTEKNYGPMKAAFFSLSRDWAAFYQVFLSPGVLVLVSAAGALVYLSESAGPEALPQGLRVAFAVVVSVLSSAVGALVWKRWNESSESGVLVTRGKSAVRGLNLLLQSLAAAEGRLIRFRGDIQNTQNSSDHFLLMCDEIQDRIDLLQEETMNAMQEWTDILPEADVKTQIGVITKLKKQRAALEAEVKSLSKKFDDPKEINEELQAELENKEAALKQVRELLSQRETAISSSVLSGLTRKPILDLLGDFHSLGSHFETSSSFEFCPNCKARFSEGDLRSQEKCPECGEAVDPRSVISMKLHEMVLKPKSRKRKVIPPPDIDDDEED